MTAVSSTGSRVGITEPQRRVLRAAMQIARSCGVSEWHHGDCVGSDEDVHGICLDIGIGVVAHPGVASSNRAFCRGAREVMPAKPYRLRNEDVVEAGVALIATPTSTTEKSRGGTWQTIRIARGMPTHDSVAIVWPNGSVSVERSGDGVSRPRDRPRPGRILSAEDVAIAGRILDIFLQCTHDRGGPT